jgi:hypothetical protein
MPVSDEDKQELIDSVSIELERMFTVLSGQFKPEQIDQLQLLEKIEAAFKASLIMFN